MIKLKKFGVIVLVAIVAFIAVVNLWMLRLNVFHKCDSNYSYNRDITTCIPNGFTDNKNRAAYIAAKNLLDNLGGSYLIRPVITVIEVREKTCEGCYEVVLQRDDRQYKESKYFDIITIKNWATTYWDIRRFVNNDYVPL